MNCFTKHAKWIGVKEGNYQTGCHSPALELRRCFFVNRIPTHAECLLLGLGAHILFINGTRVGDAVLSPAFTAYDKRALFLRYDVSSYLKKGENVIAVKLGDGFYNQTVVDEWNFYLASWRNSPRMLLELFLDGESVLVSDTDWRARKSEATYHNAIRTGEYYDARHEDGWKSLGYCDADWSCARVVCHAGGVIEEMTMPPMRECEHLSAVDMWKSERGWVFDFGKNIAGYVSLCCRGKAGDTVTLRYAEQLKGKEIDQSGINCYVDPSAAFSEDRYTFCGEGLEEWRPEFVFHGFRYVEFCWGSEEAPDLSALTAYFVHTDLARKGNFTCSHELLNWIYDAGVRSFLSNYQGIPMDCPHREKNGWTGDAAISADFAVCHFDMKEAYLKWMRDMTDAQRVSGQLPGIVPTSGWGYHWGAGPAWDFALFALPYVLYLETGNAESLFQVYGAAQAYLRYAESREDAEGLVCYGLSDWCAPKRMENRNLMPNRFSDSCYYCAMNCIAAKIAELSGDGGKAEYYQHKAREIKERIRSVYATDEQIASHGQGALAFLICFGIVEGEEAQRVADRLAALVKADGYVHKVGILGMKALPYALSAHGYTDVAYRMLTRTDYPSYGYWRSLGESTLCEVWEEGQSRNHHMYADVLNWMTRHIAGLQNRGVAYDKAAFVPHFFADTCGASACTETPRGEISISWSKTSTELVADVVVPRGTEATLELFDESRAVSTGRIVIKL